MRKPGESSPEIEQLMRGVLRLDAKILALTLGFLGALAIFAATNWLVLKGGPTVGPHLRLLSQYFLGYRVTFAGSLVGAAYGFAVGALSGLVIGWVYNRVAAWRH